MKSLGLSVLCVAVLAFGCDDGESSEAEADMGAGGEAGAAGAGGEAGEAEFTLQFAASVGDEPAACGQTYSGLGTSGASAELADARLFVSGVQLRGADGAWVDLALDQETPWQHESLALLDFEDGSAGCADSGTAELNDTISGAAPAGSYDAVRLTVGVPFALNHLDSAAAPAPLNSPGMFWVWQGGFKFVRVDWKVEGGVLPRWNVHVGSTMCASAAPTAPPEAPCARPNTAQITVEDFDPGADTLTIDLAALVGDADPLLNVEGSPPGCMSNPMEGDDCAPVFETLGLDFTTGACADGCAAQGLFAVE